MYNKHSHIDYSSAEALPPRLDIKMISAMRVLLALSALTIIYIDPLEPSRLVGVTYFALLAYSVYSLLVYALSVRRTNWLPLRSLHWIDLGWYLGLIALSSGTNSIFFFFLFFAILVGSFWWGFGPGLSVTITSVALFTIVGYASAPPEPEFRLNRFLLRPIILFVLGYLIAYWGGYEIRLKQRLQFLKDINRFSNPRFGIEQTMNSAMDRLRAFFRADSCVLVIRNEDGGGYKLIRSRRPESNETRTVDLNEDLTRLLLSRSPREAVIESGGVNRSLVYDIVTGESSYTNGSNGPVANALDAKSFLSVPVYYRRKPIGRLFVTGQRDKLGTADVDFVLQVTDQIIPVLDNIRLVDELASDAAEQERQKIARDIHDGVVQPYIGLNLGLAAIGQKLERGDSNVSQDVKNLSELVSREIADWRDYIGGLKDGTQSGAVLVPAIRRFATRFSKATGIDVSVNAPDGLRVNDRLAAEVFFMITEGLSNIRRHTQAHRAEAEMICENGHLTLNLKNENGEGSTKLFRPRSLSERAEALGGELTVLSDSGNQTVVRIDIPL